MTYPRGKMAIALHNRLRDETIKEIEQGESRSAIIGVYTLAWRLAQLEEQLDRLNEWISVQGRDGTDPRRYPRF